MNKIIDITLVQECNLVPGVYSLNLTTTFEELMRWVNQNDFRLIYIKGRGVEDERELVSRIIKATGYPDPFGSNWDALWDLITDLNWISGQGYVLFFDGFRHFARRHPNEFSKLIEILEDAIQDWKNQWDKPMYIFLRWEDESGDV